MKRQHLVTGIVILGLLHRPALAILGVGDVVFDPSNYAQALKEFVQMEQQYEQLVRTYALVHSQYDQMVYMAKQVPVNMAARYRAVLTPWTFSSAQNTYGTTGDWVSAINTGIDPEAAFHAASEPLLAYGQALANVPADQLDRLKKHYGSLELADGAIIAGVGTLGRLRGNARQVEATLQRLEDDSLSSDPDYNTEIAELNKINAAGMLQLRTSQDTNKVLVTLAEQQLLEAKRRRDAQAEAINHHVRFMAEERQLLQSQTEGASQAMLAWRMP